MNRPSCLRIGFSLAAFCAIATAAPPSGTALAGGGPENVLLVVNSNSLDSKTIANHYIALRSIPPKNVVYIDWRGGREECKGDQFLEKILKPAIESIDKRKLSEQIDYVVYSSDFPWRVNLKPLFPKEQFPKAFRPMASTTGATYLWQYMRNKNPAIILPIVNWYVPAAEGKNDQQCTSIGNVPSRGFRGLYSWERGGARATRLTQGQNYLLSTMLGVTTGRGNSVSEVIAYLRRAAQADGTRPRGTFYYMKNDDIRSQTRDGCYAATAQQISRLGISAVVMPGILPQGKPDVIGVMTGKSKFDWASSGSTFLPGAIGDHLTSLGGDLRASAGQTPLTEFLRYGAAGASGTVIEPLALQAKFPLPTLFLHYARGCSLAESFYQSVAGPYQLLIVGDPLCQPFATLPVVALDSIQPNAEVKGSITLAPKTTTLPMRRVATIELFVDGVLRARLVPGKSIQMDTTKLSDGYHELRFVAVDASPIETRGRLIVPIRVNNYDAGLELSATPNTNITPESAVRIAAKQPGATAIIVRHNDREVGRIAGEAGEIEVRAAVFGRGPIILQAESEAPHPARSAPLRLDVQ